MKNIGCGLLTGATGSFGEMICRPMFYNCSVDKLWTMLFMIPPFSIVSGFMYATGRIEPGYSSCYESTDIFMLILPVLIILLAMIFKHWIKKMTNKTIRPIIQPLMFIMLFAFIRIYRYKTTCKRMFPEGIQETGQIIMSSFLRAVIAVCVSMGIIYILTSDMLSYVPIPIIGTISFILQTIEQYMPNVMMAFILVFIHFYYNLKDNMASEMKQICTGILT